MILRSLEFSGIGPFKDQYAIDFDALSADGLFLFDGPTGSGKSTLIDAITFALFGSVAGKTRRMSESALRTQIQKSNHG